MPEADNASSRLSVVKVCLELVRSFLILAAMLWVGLSVLPALLGIIKRDLPHMQLTKLDREGPLFERIHKLEERVEASAQEAKRVITESERRAGESIEGIAATPDDPVPPEAKPAANLLSIQSQVQQLSHEINFNKSESPVSWVYVGAKKEGQWRDLHFSFDGDMPSLGREVTATTDLYLRRDAPRKVNGRWTKGDVIGLLKQGEKQRLVELTEVPGIGQKLYWAKISTR
jgi:hypothetical protein